MRPTHAVINGKTVELLTCVEMEEFGDRLNEFKGNDYRGILTLMVFFNLFDDFLESDEKIREKYKVFMNSENEIQDNETKH